MSGWDARPQLGFSSNGKQATILATSLLRSTPLPPPLPPTHPYLEPPGVRVYPCLWQSPHCSSHLDTANRICITIQRTYNRHVHHPAISKQPMRACMHKAHTTHPRSSRRAKHSACSAGTATTRARRPHSYVEYQIRIQPLPFPFPFKGAACACSAHASLRGHVALPLMETDGMDLKAIAAHRAPANSTDHASRNREQALSGLGGRERAQALQTLERTRFHTLRHLQPAHEYELRLRASILPPPAAGLRTSSAPAIAGTWSQTLRVVTPKAPPAAPAELWFEGMQETSMYVCWKPPSLLHGGGLINYEVSFSILAISDVTLRSRERSWKAGGCGGRAVQKEERLLAALVSRSLA